MIQDSVKETIRVPLILEKLYKIASLIGEIDESNNSVYCSISKIEPAPVIENCKVESMPSPIAKTETVIDHLELIIERLNILKCTSQSNAERLIRLV